VRSVSENRTKKRRHARLVLAGPMAADVAGGHEVHIVDLSLGGARLEHAVVLRPGDTCFLRFALNDQLFTFTGRVAWSNVIGRREGRANELVYQTGVAFERVPTGARALLSELIGDEDTRSPA
jgi:hypothetical protein